MRLVFRQGAMGAQGGPRGGVPTGAASLANRHAVPAHRRSPPHTHRREPGGQTFPSAGWPKRGDSCVVVARAFVGVSEKKEVGVVDGEARRAVCFFALGTARHSLGTARPSLPARLLPPRAPPHSHPHTHTLLVGCNQPRPLHIKRPTLENSKPTNRACHRFRVARRVAPTRQRALQRGQRALGERQEGAGSCISCHVLVKRQHAARAQHAGCSGQSRFDVWHRAQHQRHDDQVYASISRGGGGCCRSIVSAALDKGKRGPPPRCTG